VNRRQLEHVLRASGGVSGSREILVIGSQAILGAFPKAPEELLASMEADICPLDDPGKADLIDGTIGELSPFHETFGYYAHGVGPETAVLPARWRERLVRVVTENTGGVVGWCLSPADLAISKLLAGREKDLTYVRAMLKAGLTSKEAMEALLDELRPTERQVLQSRLAG